MTKLAIISSKGMDRVLTDIYGFEPKRQVGSHVFFEHPDGRCTVVPFHPGEDLQGEG